MGWVSGPELVAATANAGGFGFLAGATIPADEIESNIERVKQLTEEGLGTNCFGLNFHGFQANANDIVDLVIKHTVKAVSYSRAPSPKLIAKLKANQVLCIPTIGMPKHALKAIELGADALVVQGGEGGGHTGSIATSILLPQVVKAVAGKVPIVGAGGFYSGEGLLAARAWGADGIAMGTRFLMTEESLPPAITKQQYSDCKKPEIIYISRAVDGMPQRMMLNKKLETIEQSGTLKRLLIAFSNGLQYRRFTGFSMLSLIKSGWAMSRSSDLTLTQAMMSANAPMIIQKAMVDGMPDEGVLPSGQVAGVIDEIVPCQQLISTIMSEAELCLKRLVLE